MAMVVIVAVAMVVIVVVIMLVIMVLRVIVVMVVVIVIVSRKQVVGSKVLWSSGSRCFYASPVAVTVKKSRCFFPPSLFLSTS